MIANKREYSFKSIEFELSTKRNPLVDEKINIMIKRKGLNKLQKNYVA